MLSRIIEPGSILEYLALEGRWTHEESRSVVTSWAGSALSFVFFGADLELVCGARTERKDKWNGGVPMLAVSITPTTAPASAIWDNWKTFDAQPGSTLHLIEKWDTLQTEVLVRIMMIDWASVFELEALVVNKEATIHRPPISQVNRILFIGDSISCGYFVQPDGSPTPGPTPKGCLDAFPYVAHRLLSEDGPSYHFQADLVAYPGWTLVSPSDEERAEGNPIGMIKGYYQLSPWDTIEQHNYGYPTQPLAIVIGLGTNDQEYYSPERYKSDLCSFLQSMTQAKSLMPQRIWAIPPFPDGDQLTELRREFPVIIQELQETFSQLEICDINNWVEQKDTIDGIHPTMEGHKRLGQDMARFIQVHLATSNASIQ